MFPLSSTDTPHRQRERELGPGKCKGSVTTLLQTQSSPIFWFVFSFRLSYNALINILKKDLKPKNLYYRSGVNPHSQTRRLSPEKWSELTQVKLRQFEKTKAGIQGSSIFYLSSPHSRPRFLHAELFVSGITEFNLHCLSKRSKCYFRFK